MTHTSSVVSLSFISTRPPEDYKTHAGRTLNEQDEEQGGSQRNKRYTFMSQRFRLHGIGD